MLKYKYILKMKYTETLFFKQHSETVMVQNLQNADYSSKNKFIVLLGPPAQSRRQEN